jgi:16S rRNA (guanine527-N7)-methyltransferase
LNSGEQEKLRSWAREFGINLTSYQIGLLGTHLDELWEWNKKTNLTGLSSRKKIIQELMLDSMIPSVFLPDSGRLLDIGSGAGFPGIPLVICKPGLTAHFLEPSSKKTSFLKQTIRLTELRQIHVIRGRIEQCAGLLETEGYHIITARALAHLPLVLEWCAPHLAEEGMIVNFQGEQFQKSLEDSSDVISQQGLFLYRTIPYSLPGKDSQRNILIFKRK